MVNMIKVSDNLNGYTQEILRELKKELDELKKVSIASQFDKELSKRLSETDNSTK